MANSTGPKNSTQSDVRGLITDYFAQARMMQLATSKDNHPWVCNVWFAADDDLNIYWFSSTARRHSGEVRENNRVAGAVVLPLTPDDVPRGVQFEGVAEELDSDADMATAMQCYAGRIFTEEKVRDLIKNRQHKFYRIKPQLFVLFDAEHFPDQPRQEWRP
jgi:uncharacterized protein YhbP (UPF0306 family)